MLYKINLLSDVGKYCHFNFYKMKFILLLLFFCAILKPSLSVPVKDVSQINVRQKSSKTNVEKSASDQYSPTIVKSLEATSNVNHFYEEKNGNTNEIFFPKTNFLGKAEKYSEVGHIIMQPSYEKKENRTSLTSEMKEYFFFSDRYGKVTIIDQEYHVISSYEILYLTEGIGAIVNNKFYNIDTRNGQIIRTDIENFMSFGNDFHWDMVGTFPNENYFMRNQVAVNDSSTIYFVTYSGILYAYEIASEATKKTGNVEHWNVYASLLIVDKILYIHVYSHFYSSDGITLEEIVTPLERMHCGLFQLGSRVCRLGGNTTATFPDPVSCYDPSSDQWSIEATLNELMWYPGITAGQFGIYVFGEFTANGLDSYWRNACFLLNQDPLVLSYIPCPFTEAPMFPQAISFLH